MRTARRRRRRRTSSSGAVYFVLVLVSQSSKNTNTQNLRLSYTHEIPIQQDTPHQVQIDAVGEWPTARLSVAGSLSTPPIRHTHRARL